MTETAKMYGGSLYDLAAEEGLETRILGELDEVQQLLKQNPDYLRLLSTPSIPKKERCGLLDEALRGQVHLYVLNFLKILCEKGTLRELSGCARAYRIRYNQLPVRIRLPRHAIKHRLQMLFFRPVCRNDDTDAQGSRMLPLERKCLFVRLLPGIDLLFLPNPLQHRPHGISDSVFLQIIPGFFQIG